MKPIIKQKKVCYFCGDEPVHKHHVFYGSNRQMSEKYGCVVYLCWYHHEHPQEGVHWTDPKNHLIGKAHDLFLKQLFQGEWEKRFGTREDFIKAFGRSWL